MRTRSQWILAAGLSGLAAPVAGQGTIDIQPTPFDTGMVVDVIVQASGPGGGCTNFILQRKALIGCEGYVTIATIPRQTGSFTHRTFDFPLTPNTAYAYQVLPCSGFTWAHDCGWGLGISALTMTTGPGATPIGHGFLKSSGNPWGYVDCGGIDCWGANIVDLPADANQYVDTDVPVILYGGFVRNCQFEWLYVVTEVVPSPCTVSVDAATWGFVKRIFR